MLRLGRLSVAFVRIATVALGIATVVAGFGNPEMYWLYGLGIALTGVGLWPNPRPMLGLWAAAAGVTVGGASTVRFSQSTGLTVAITLAVLGVAIVLKGPALVARLRGDGGR